MKIESCPASDGINQLAAFASGNGLFVEVAGDPRSIGKLISASSDAVEVEFFRSIKEREQSALPTSTVSRAYLAPQTRVYFTDSVGERWAMGRVRGYFIENDGSVTYEVRTPNQRDIDVHERSLWTRCFGLGADPAEVLALGAAESQFWHDARWAAREIITRLRSAANGLTGLTAASVELIPHQVEAVRRVLLDPLQRYLLADEVGLGKTIEAGAVVSQLLADHPERDVLIAAPGPLVAQWTRELHARFGIDPSSDIRVRLVAFEALEHERPRHLLVVDEAHRCAPGTSTHGHIERLAGQADKLLLLSATPLIGAEETFLGLLRWLDPERWAGEPIEVFRRHVARSQEYGRLLLGLRPDVSSFLLKQRMAAARQTFPDDPIVQLLVDRFNAAPEADQRVAISGDLREHVAEAYWIHHRLVRARRSDLDGWEFKPRGPSSVREEMVDDGGAEDVATALEDWRLAALLSLEEAPSKEDALASRYANLLELAGQGSHALSNLVPLEPLFSGEDALLSAIRETGTMSHPGKLTEFVAEVVERQLRFLRQAGVSSPKVVVFTSGSAQALIPALDQRLGEAVADGVSSIDQLRDVPGLHVAVLEADGEEGLNLHFADALVHADLPFNVTRIEQRIGRLDRFGRTKGPIRHVAIIPEGEDDSPWSCWLDLLRTGLAIFDRPISDLQFALDDIERELRRVLLRDAGPGLVAYKPVLEERLNQERERLNEQYALDQLAFSRESGRVLVEEIETAEADEAELATRVDHLLVKVLEFQRRALDRDVYSLAWGRDTLLPIQPWKPIFDAALRRPVTWRRRIAENRDDVSLLRPGAPLIDALDHLIEWDDRGSAFATWRLRPGFGGQGEERLAFRLCWLVSPQPIAGAGLRRDEERTGLDRRAASFLKPWTVVQYLGADLASVGDREFLRVLREPYRPDAEDGGGRDYNLGSREAWLHQIVDHNTFARLCAEVRDRGRTWLQDSDAYKLAVANAMQRATADVERRQLRTQSRHQSEGTAEGARRRQLELDTTVLDAVRQPLLRLDSVGAFVVAGYAPSERRP